MTTQTIKVQTTILAQIRSLDKWAMYKRGARLVVPFLKNSSWIENKGSSTMENDLTASTAKRLFDIYENECKSRSEFVAILCDKDWTLILGTLDIPETMAKVIWECMNVTADHYFEDVE